MTPAFKKLRRRAIKRRHKELQRLSERTLPDETQEEVGRDETLDALPDPD